MEFDTVRWCEELGQHLAALSSKVRPSFRYEFPEEEPLPPILPIPVAHESARRRYRNLAERSQHDPSAAEAFHKVGLSYHDADLAGVLATFREHPVLRCALVEGEPETDEAVDFLYPFGSSSRIELKTLALNLTKLTLKTNGVHAAQTLNRFLTAGETHRLNGREITLIWGLRSDCRLDIGTGVFLAPYAEVAAIHGPHPFARDDESPERASTTARRHRLLRDSPEQLTALVREFTWGPAVAQNSERSGLPIVRLSAAADEGVFPPMEDNERIRDLLTIATERHQLSGGRYVPVDRWLADIDPNYRFSWNSDSGSVSDWWQTTDLSSDSAQTFSDLVEGWARYQGDRKRLDSAIRQLATLYSRAGRSASSDRILDAATALEVLYGLSSPELTYKLRVRAGFFLRDTPEERQKTFDQMGKFYKARSAIIHGGSRRRSPDPEDALSYGLKIARETLIALLRLGHAPNWDRMVMSAGENLDADR